MPGYDIKECMKDFMAWLRENPDRCDNLPDFETMLFENPRQNPDWLEKWEDDLTPQCKMAIFFAGWKTGYSPNEVVDEDLDKTLLGHELPDVDSVRHIRDLWTNRDREYWTGDIPYFYWTSKRAGVYTFFIPAVKRPNRFGGLGATSYFEGATMAMHGFHLPQLEGRRKTFLHNIKYLVDDVREGNGTKLIQTKWIKETLAHQERQFNALEKVKLAEKYLAELRSELEAAELCKETQLAVQRALNDLTSAMNTLVWQGGKMVGQTRAESRLLFEQGIDNKKPKIKRVRKMLITE